MAEELTFKDAAAAEYDRAFAHVTAHFMPFLMRAAHLAPGMRVLDIATGTGLSAEAALAAVGPTGYVTAVDISPAMVEKARERFGEPPNVSVSVEEGQALSFSGWKFRRGTVQSRSHVLLRPGAWSLGISQSASAGRAGSRLGQYRGGALL